MKKILAILIFLSPFICAAQPQTGGNLTVFSEDGDKFFLVLNGEKQNEVPQSNIKIEDLPQPYYSAKIMFEDKTFATISKTNLMITDVEGKMMDVTYKIKKDKNNKVKLTYYSMIPVPQDFMPPSGMYVRQYGQPIVAQGNVNQTTTTTTTTNGMGASLNLPGVSMNISINEPNEVHTTTTTTTHSNTNHQQQQTQTPPPSRGCMNNLPMNASDFAAAKKTINESSFDDTKLKTAQSIASSNCLSCDQVVQICSLFSFEENKFAFAKYAYKYSTDPRNYFKVNNVFSFSASKEELSEFIEKD